MSPQRPKTNEPKITKGLPAIRKPFPNIPTILFPKKLEANASTLEPRPPVLRTSLEISVILSGVIVLDVDNTSFISSNILAPFSVLFTKEIRLVTASTF